MTRAQRHTTSRLVAGFACAVLVLASGSGTALAQREARHRPPVDHPVLAPIDPLEWQDQDDMTWDDYTPIPGIDWSDPQHEASEETVKVALLAMDFPDQPFVITQPKHGDDFGNPQVDPIAREDVPQFYADFWGTPNEFNHGRTVGGFWMEQTYGRVDVEFTPFGPYRMPRNLFEYGLNEWRGDGDPDQPSACPSGYTCDGRMERDVDALWEADAGEDIEDEFDLVLRIYAGYDETSVWQEFGEMIFQTKEDIPDSWGPPDPDLPNWVGTRYVDWTSWKAGAQQWGSASMRQGESSGTITHEIVHTFGIGDNNNNPYVEPYHRVGSGTWDNMDRGSFNGPGGPHMRWVVPANMGAAMPAGNTLRTKLELGHVDDEQVLTVDRDALADSGVVTAEVTARSIHPGPGGLTGIEVEMAEDRSPACDPDLDPMCSGNTWDYYTLETVQRIGTDSFTPDNGVLLAKNKDGRGDSSCGYRCFTWVIDANPQDIDMVDFYRPDGTPVMRTIADYRQLNDGLFHAGTRSGSEYEWVDEDNRLHFYVLDRHHDDRGVLSYDLAVRSLDGSGPHARGAALGPASIEPVARGFIATCTFPLTNTGAVADVDAGHPDDVRDHVGADVYRLAASSSADGWEVTLPNALAAVEAGDTVSVPVHVDRRPPNAAATTVTLSATSESDPSATATSTCEVSVRDTVVTPGR